MTNNNGVRHDYKPFIVSDPIMERYGTIWLFLDAREACAGERHGDALAAAQGEQIIVAGDDDFRT